MNNECYAIKIGKEWYIYDNVLNVIVINHGDDEDADRPKTGIKCLWVGAAMPNNAREEDWWEGER